MTAPTINPKYIGGFDIKKIMELLPHRYPLLLVDRVLHIEPGSHIDAYKCVTMNEPFFQGHFPGLPVMPGVLIVESLAQAGGLFALAHRPDMSIENDVFLFTGIDKVKFRKPVYPGDRLDLHCKLIRNKLRLWKMHGTVHVDGILACEAELTAAMMPKEDM